MNSSSNESSSSSFYEENNTKTNYVDANKIKVPTASKAHAEKNKKSPVKGVAFRSKEEFKSDTTLTTTASEHQGLIHIKRRSTQTQLALTSLISKLSKKVPNNLEDNYVPKLSCIDRFIFRCFSSKKAFLCSVCEIHGYMQLVDREWEDILKLFQWTVLPGGQHRKARGYNYLSHQLWILSLAAGSSYSQDSDHEDYYKDCFEEIVQRSESIGVVLRSFLPLVSEVESVITPLDDMMIALNFHLQDRYRILKSGIELDEIFKECLIPEIRKYRRRDYLKLKVCTRDVGHEEWEEFSRIWFTRQMNRLQSGLKEISWKLKSIQDGIPSVLKILENARVRKYRKYPTLLSHILEMDRNMREMLKKAGFSSDEQIIRMALKLSYKDVNFVVEQIIFFMKNMWEVILMGRLCYSYVQSGPNACNSMLEYRQCLGKKMKNSDQIIAPELTYDWRQFYVVNCASILRKLPVTVGNTVEFALQYGH